MRPAEGGGRAPRTFLGGEVDRICCVKFVLGIIVGLVMEWFIFGMHFHPYPPDCIVINQGLIGRDSGSGMLYITNKTATIRSYVDSPGLKVEYKDIHAVVTFGEVGKEVQEITPRIRLGDVNLDYGRFHMWPINFTSSKIPIQKNIKPTPSSLFTLEMNLKMKWFCFWSIRSGTFEMVTILCPVQPENINKAMACISRS